MPESPVRADAKRNRSRILAEAAAVFAEKGASASTEEVAARAGVAIGTVFRHFPTKRDLLQAIVKDLLERLTEEAATLAADGDPATALFDYFRHMVAQAAAKKTVADLLAADTGVQLEVSGPVLTLSAAVQTLLSRAQHCGAVDPAVRLDEVMALLTATCQGALRSGWSPDLQERTLTIVFAGLRDRSSQAGEDVAAVRRRSG